MNKSESYKDILKEAPNFFESYQSGYTLEKRSGALNMAYVDGVVTQKLRSSVAAGSFSDSGYAPIYENQAARGIINYGVNILIDPFRNILTAMLQNTPGYEVYPAIEDQDKNIIAKEATKILKYHDDNIFDLKAKIGELYTWATIPSATAFLELFPEDTNILFPVAGTEEDDKIVNSGVAVDSFGRKSNATIQQRKEKRLQIAVKTIWDVACSEDSPDGLIDSCTIQIGRVAITIRKLKTFASAEAVAKIEKGLATATSIIPDPKTMEVRAAKGLGSKSAGSILTGDDRQIMVYVVYHKPCDEYKNGWYGIADDKGNELYFIDSLPIAGIMPYTQLNTNNLPAGEFIKKSVFDDARGPQVLYQGIFDSRAVHSMYAARPTRVRIKGVKSSSDKKNPNGIYPKQGEVETIEFDEPWRGAVMANPDLAISLSPRFESVPGLNSDVATLLEECKQQVLNVTGQNLANVGAFPNADISGASVQEQVSVDAMGQLPMISLINNFWARFRRKVLAAVRAYYTTEQIAYMLSDDTISNAQKFKLENLDDSFDVRIISTDGLPATPMGKIEFFGKLMAMAPTEDERMDAWNKIKEIIAGYGMVENDDSIEEKLAQIENKMILEDDSLISDMDKMVPAIDSIGNPITDQMNNPVMEPKAKQRVQAWANRFQNEVMHIKEHRPMVVGPDMLRNGEKITQLIAWHIERHEENYAIKNKPPEPSMAPTEGEQ